MRDALTILFTLGIVSAFALIFTGMIRQDRRPSSRSAIAQILGGTLLLLLVVCPLAVALAPQS